MVEERSASLVTRFAPAKLNLYLHVTGRRPDGYHELDSLVVFLDVGDRVTVEPAAEFRLQLRGQNAAALVGEDDNLVLRAARLLAAEAGRFGGASILLEKELPVAAGLGGGSSDAAATMRALAQLWTLNLGEERLAALALGLGADLPACLRAKPLRMRGIGERLSEVPALPRFAVVLANPRVPLATRDVFGARRSDFSPVAWLPERFEDFNHLLAVLDSTGNDLEAPACALEPRVGQLLGVLGQLPGARLARMSGSGATCFALFDDLRIAEAAAARLRHVHPSWWITAAELVAAPTSPKSD